MTRFDFSPFAQDAARKTQQQKGAGGRFAAGAGSRGTPKKFDWRPQRGGWRAKYDVDGNALPGGGYVIEDRGATIVLHDQTGAMVQTHFPKDVESAKSFAEQLHYHSTTSNRTKP